MPKFFLSPDAFQSRTIRVTGEDAAHIAGPLRMRPGEPLTLSDGDGTEYRANILSVSTGEVLAEILSSAPSTAEPKLRVTLYLPLLKAGSVEDVIKQAVEIGVSRVVPVLTSRCVVRLKASEFSKKRERYQKIALEAAKQSGRARIPEVLPLMEYAEAIAQAAENSTVVLAYENADVPLRPYLMEQSAPSDVSVFTGPEGGFSTEEIACATRHGIVPLSLGPRILRAATAPIYLLSVLLYQWT